MIRINLLGTPKSKNKHSAASTVAAMDMGDVGSPAMKVAVAAALLVVFNLGYWYKLDREKQSIATKMTAAEQKNHELAGVKARYLERQKQAENYKRHVAVIDQLRAQQAGPVHLLNTIGSTANTTEAVWRSSMIDRGKRVDINCMTLEADAV